MTAQTCQWRVYIIKDNFNLDLDAWEGSVASFLDNWSEEVLCTQSAITEFVWSTQRMRETYHADKSPVCSEHLEDFMRSDRISQYIQEGRLD